MRQLMNQQPHALWFVWRVLASPEEDVRANREGARGQSVGCIGSRIVRVHTDRAKVLAELGATRSQAWQNLIVEWLPRPLGRTPHSQPPVDGAIVEGSLHAAGGRCDVFRAHDAFRNT